MTLPTEPGRVYTPDTRLGWASFRSDDFKGNGVEQPISGIAFAWLLYVHFQIGLPSAL